MEPLYTYVRGTGWVCSVVERSESFNLYSGESVHFEFRKPNLGEYYDSVNINSRYFTEGKPNWPVWVELYSSVSHSGCSEWRSYLTFSPRDTYVTLVFE